jgi:hypothetical protein
MRARKVDSVKQELVELNDRFHKKSLLNEVFYKKLMQNGFTY